MWALWIPISWKSSPHHNLLTEQPVLYAKIHPRGPWSYCFTGCGISDPPALLHSPTRPTLHSPTWSPLCWAHLPALPGRQSTGLHNLHQACNTQARTISTRTVPLRPARPTLYFSFFLFFLLLPWFCYFHYYNSANIKLYIVQGKKW
jgi:hypothetical protein